jgi:hypothetical protein
MTCGLHYTLLPRPSKFDGKSAVRTEQTFAAVAYDTFAPAAKSLSGPRSPIRHFQLLPAKGIKVFHFHSINFMPTRIVVENLKFDV